MLICITYADSGRRPRGVRVRVNPGYQSENLGVRRQPAEGVWGRGYRSGDLDVDLYYVCR